MRLPDEVVAAIPRHVAKRYRVVPVYRHDGAIGVALSDPSDLDTIDTLHHLLKAGCRAQGGRAKRISTRR